MTCWRGDLQPALVIFVSLYVVDSRWCCVVRCASFIGNWRITPGMGRRLCPQYSPALAGGSTGADFDRKQFSWSENSRRNRPVSSLCSNIAKCLKVGQRVKNATTTPGYRAARGCGGRAPGSSVGSSDSAKMATSVGNFAMRNWATGRCGRWPCRADAADTRLEDHGPIAAPGASPSMPGRCDW